jgi:hypothetical protein
LLACCGKIKHTCLSFPLLQEIGSRGKGGKAYTQICFNSRQKRGKGDGKVHFYTSFDIKSFPQQQNFSLFERLKFSRPLTI